MARFEIVRTDAEQPWHMRLVSNGRTLMSSEQYARKVGAQRAVEAAGRAFSPSGMAMLSGEWLSVWLDHDGSAGEKVAIPVRYIDARRAGAVRAADIADPERRYERVVVDERGAK